MWLEKFPVYPHGLTWAHISTAELSDNGLYNCHDDIELFLYVNKYNTLSKSK